MINNSVIGVAIPCFRGGEATVRIVKDVLKYADYVVLIDDNCPLSTGKLVASNVTDEKLHIIYNQKNLGVGGSTKKGFIWLLDQDCDLILKVDADGQIVPSDIPKMCQPIIKNECEATKGNRFTNIDTIILMPKIRLIGNIALSFITKLSTGYWELFDPTNGFLCFNTNSLQKINLHKTDNRFFFETDLLFRCSLKNICIRNVDIDPIYNNQYSSLNPLRELPRFLYKHLILLFKRIVYQYFLLDFNPGSIELVFSIILGIFSMLFGMYSIYSSHATGDLTSAGTASIFVVTSIISFQLFLSFIYYDCTIRLILKREYLRFK